VKLKLRNRDGKFFDPKTLVRIAGIGVFGVVAILITSDAFAARGWLHVLYDDWSNRHDPVEDFDPAGLGGGEGGDEGGGGEGGGDEGGAGAGGSGAGGGDDEDRHDDDDDDSGGGGGGIGPCANGVGDDDCGHGNDEDGYDEDNPGAATSASSMGS
jgi:hypothetical protein